MTIISTDYDGSDSYYFSEHGTQVILKAGVAYSHTGSNAAFVLNDTYDRFLVAGLIYSDTFGINLAGNSATIDVASTGLISGYSAGIYLSQGAQGATVNNYGVISGSYGISAGYATGPLTIHNYGAIQATTPGLVILTGAGSDTIDGTGTIAGDIDTGAGGDRIDVHLGVMTGTIFGGAGDDTYVIAAGQAVSEFQNGYDTGGRDLVVSYGDYTLSAYVENLDLVGPATIGRGNEGNNSITGNDLGDHLFGGAGVDTIQAGSGDDVVRGGAGDDTMISIEGQDRFYGQSGDDIVIVGLDQVSIDGGAGADVAAFLYNDTAITVDLSLATGAVKGGAAALDTLTSIEGVWGSEFNDTLTGNALANDFVGYLGDDVIKGMAGDDKIEGFAGADQLDGGDGIDTLSFENDVGGVRASLLTNTGTFGAAAGDTYLNFENLRGGQGADTLIGSATNNTVEGGAGNDLLNGGGGVDTLFGDAGDDVLIGGGAQDLFCFRDVTVTAGVAMPGGFGKDTINDFQDGTDRISFAGNSLVHSLSDLTVAQSGTSTVVTVTGTTDQITILHLSAANFTSADVIFG